MDSPKPFQFLIDVIFSYNILSALSTSYTFVCTLVWGSIRPFCTRGNIHRTWLLAQGTKIIHALIVAFYRDYIKKYIYTINKGVSRVLYFLQRTVYLAGNPYVHHRHWVTCAISKTTVGSVPLFPCQFYLRSASSHGQRLRSSELKTKNRTTLQRREVRAETSTATSTRRVNWGRS